MFKMKKINILLVSAIMLFATSCDLDRKPFDGLTAEQQFSSVNGFNDAVKGIYSGFRGGGYYSANGYWITSGDVFSDNLTLNQQGRLTQKSLFELQNTAIDNSFPIYGRAYIIISRANAILDNLDGIPKTAKRDQFEAEALAARAILHFDIARVYCKIPTQSPDAKQSMGIHYSKTYAPDSKNRRKGTTVDGVYQNVIQDLLKARDLIGDFKEYGRLNKNAINGLLAKVYLFYGDYENAAKYAQEVVNAGVAVTPRNKVAALWKDEHKPSVLFAISIVDKDRAEIGTGYGQSAKGENRAEYVCSDQLYKLFKDTDIRKTTSVEVGLFSEKYYRSVAKYFGRSSGNKNVVDGKYLRVEEVYLTLAEALARQGGKDAEALAVLDKLRKERYEGFTSANETGANLLDAILLERRLELAFEGDRFFTLKRLALGLNRGSEGEFADGTGTAPRVLTYPADGYRWQLPIPQGAIDAFPELLEDQNPGY